MNNIIKTFDPKKQYAFDAAKYVEHAKNTAITISDVEFNTLVIGDGTPVEIVTKTIGMCKGLAVLPSYCREVTSDV